jgi:hypothetical protein
MAGDRPSTDSRLIHVRAAQLRARAFRFGIGKSAFGSLFLMGALAYALAPDRHSSTSLTWMAALVVLSTFHVGLGLRTIARARRRAQRLWLPMTLAWGILATVLLKFLLRQ